MLTKEFKNRYRGYKQREDVEAPKWLTGIAECENSVNGFDGEEVVLIGDEREARKVVQMGIEGSKGLEWNLVGT